VVAFRQAIHFCPSLVSKKHKARITRKLGRPQAITATAHKLARIVFHLLSTKEAYNESIFHKTEEETLRRAQYRLRRQAAQLGFQNHPRRERLMFLGSRHVACFRITDVIESPKAGCSGLRLQNACREGSATRHLRPPGRTRGSSVPHRFSKSEVRSVNEE